MSRKISELVAVIKSFGKSESDIIKVLETEFSSEIEKFEEGLDESDYLMKFVVWALNVLIKLVMLFQVQNLQ